MGGNQELLSGLIAGGGHTLRKGCRAERGGGFLDGLQEVTAHEIATREQDRKVCSAKLGGLKTLGSGSESPK